jgi:hypothetical protein
MNDKNTESVRQSYDRVADEYARRISGELQRKPFDREVSPGSISMRHRKPRPAAVGSNRRKGRKKGSKAYSFGSGDGFAKTGTNGLERIGGATRLELATSAVTEMLVECLRQIVFY